MTDRDTTPNEDDAQHQAELERAPSPLNQWHDGRSNSDNPPPMLALIGARGGAGTSTLAVAVAMHTPHALLVDAAPSPTLPAHLGMASDPEHGSSTWNPTDDPGLLTGALAIGGQFPAPADRVRLLPAGTGGTYRGRIGWRNVFHALAADRFAPVVIDAGPLGSPAARAALEDPNVRTLLVTRACYLSLRTVTKADGTPDAVALIDEPGRALGAQDLASVTMRPVVARVPVRHNIARAIDAGTLAMRLPAELARPAARIARAFTTPAHPEPLHV